MSFFYIKKKGVVAVYVAISMVILFLFTALVIDAGMIGLTKGRLQNVADASVLAAIREPSSEAEKEARIYAKYNGMDIEIDKALQVNTEEDIVVDSTESRALTVTAWRNVHYFFAKVFSGSDFVRVSAKASAANSAINVVGKGLKPFAIAAGDAANDEALQTLITIKEGAHFSFHGNFSTVNFSATNKDDYKFLDSIVPGSKYSHYIGEEIFTETGNMAHPTWVELDKLYTSCNDGCTVDSYMTDCPRLITIPILNTIDVNGTKKVVIVGFATIFLEKPVFNGGQTTINGVLIKKVISGDIDLSLPDSAYEVKVVKLTD